MGRFLSSLSELLLPTDTRSACRVLALRLYDDEGPTHAWQRVMEELDPPAEDDEVRPLRMMVDRRGFRARLGESMVRLSQEERPPHALILSNVERLPLSIVEDFQLAWNESLAMQRKGKVVPILMTGAIGGGEFPNFLWLQDYGIDEALVALDLDDEPVEMEEAVARSGGIPSLVHALEGLDGFFSESDLDQRWEPVAQQIRSIIGLVSVQQQLQDRLQQLCLQSKPTQRIDEQLAEVGLVRIQRHGGGVSSLRAPFIADLLSD